MANLCELHDLWIEDVDNDAVNDLVGKLRPEAFRSASNEVTQKCAHAGGVGVFSEMKVSEKVQGLW